MLKAVYIELVKSIVKGVDASILGSLIADFRLTIIAEDTNSKGGGHKIMDACCL